MCTHACFDLSWKARAARLIFLIQALVLTVSSKGTLVAIRLNAIKLTIGDVFFLSSEYLFDPHLVNEDNFRFGGHGYVFFLQLDSKCLWSMNISYFYSIYNNIHRVSIKLIT